MSRPTVVVTDALPPQVLAGLSAQFAVHRCDGADRPALLAAVAGADALIIRSATRVDREVLAAAPQLKIISRAGGRSRRCRCGGCRRSRHPGRHGTGRHRR
ncbi:hypothetical protein [Streptomyces sp. NPDC006134]|uniref:hypothetical protein n=1 Tax=Streptomyces sp. NPDC006134 TaxID=3154467 RepID=UPI0033C36B01